MAEEASGAAPRPDQASGLLAAALGTVSGNPKVDDLLDRQIALADLQIEEMAHEIKLRHWSLRFANVSAVMKVSFEIAVAIIVTAVAAVLCGAIWSAAHDDGLVIEAFGVPPDLAGRGLTGQIVAGQLQDELARMSTAPTVRPTDTYRNNWADDIKVEIPDTGVSIGEFNRYLRAWLGHETRISGAVYRTPDGIAVTVRAGDTPGETFTGAEKDLPALVEKAAEHVFAATQPYRYSEYLQTKKRFAEEFAVIRRLVADGPASERPWAYAQLGCLEITVGDLDRARAFLNQSLALDPTLASALGNLETVEVYAGHDQRALDVYGRQLDVIRHGQVRGLSTEAARLWEIATPVGIEELLGDYRAAIPNWHRMAQGPDLYGSKLAAVAAEAADSALNHDVAAARRALSQTETNDDGALLVPLLQFGMYELPNYAMAAERQDWRAALADAEAADRSLTHPDESVLHTAPFGRKTWVWPWLAFAKAKLGDVAGAHALIDRTPSDCYLCVRTRGKIDAVQKNWAGAGYWFAIAAKQGPSIPFAYTDWGAMLLAKGDRDGAIAKFAAANAKGPHFADPLEMLGEALMAKNRSDLALAKFAEAEKYAPNWGRLHLKWGEALLWSGDKAGAQKQFATAARLDLSTTEKSELSRAPHV